MHLRSLAAVLAIGLATVLTGPANAALGDTALVAEGEGTFAPGYDAVPEPTYRSFDGWLTVSGTLGGSTVLATCRLTAWSADDSVDSAHGWGYIDSCPFRGDLGFVRINNVLSSTYSNMTLDGTTYYHPRWVCVWVIEGPPPRYRAVCVSY